MNTLVVVRTPLQLLNAIEARIHFNLNHCALVILTNSRTDTKYFSPFVNSADWTEVHYFSPKLPEPPPSASRRSARRIRSVIRRLRMRARLDRFFSRFASAECLVLGHYGQSYFLHIANILRAPNCIIVDDGTDSLSVARKRFSIKNKVEPVSLRPTALARRAKKLITRRIDWIAQQRPAVTFFSSYSLQIPSQDRLIRNSYEFAKKTIGAREYDEICLFIGQPLVDDGYLDRSEFESLLLAIKIQLSPAKIVYVPHPREERRSLTHSLSKIRVNIKSLETPVEYHLMIANRLPRMVASFFSSALDTCRLIWGGRMRIVAFRIPERSFVKHWASCEEIYNYFETNSEGEIEIERIQNARRES